MQSTVATSNYAVVENLFMNNILKFVSGNLAANNTTYS